MASYLAIETVRCDCCGEWTWSFSDRSNWWGKYLKPDEEKICRNCIKDRDGYAEEFRRQIGVSMDVLNEMEHLTYECNKGL